MNALTFDDLRALAHACREMKPDKGDPAIEIHEGGIRLGILGQPMFAVSPLAVYGLFTAVVEAVIKARPGQPAHVTPDGHLSPEAPPPDRRTEWLTVTATAGRTITVSRFTLNMLGRFEGVQMLPATALALGVMLRDTAQLIREKPPAEIIEVAGGPLLIGPKTMGRWRKGPY